MSLDNNLWQDYHRLVRPEIANILRLLKLDITFTAGEGDTIKYQKNGIDVEVIDLLGGYGSLILGHNNPEICKKLNWFYNQRKVTHNQASVKEYPTLLARELNSEIKKHLGCKENFVFNYASTGAEAVEAAIKHSFMSWNLRKRKIEIQIRSAINNPTTTACERSTLKALNDKLVALRPVIVAVEGSFHGKTLGAVSLTENFEYRENVGKAAFEVQFINRNLDKQVTEDLLSSLDFNLNLGTTEILFSPVVAFVFEPIQGEGGVFVLDLQQLQCIRKLFKNRDIPWIVDEIQSGFYRTGQLLAYFGEAPEYILLGKSLGAGYSKLSVCAIVEGHYLPSFGRIHTSTFGEDEFSCFVGLNALNELTNNQEIVREKAIVFEKSLKSLALALKAQYPNIIKDCRGKGFLIGIEFNFDNNESLPALWHAFNENGHAGYLLISYLLYRHGIRMGATLSNPSTIRIEPSFMVNQEVVSKLKQALTDVCEKLSQRKIFSLVQHLFDQNFSDEQINLISPPRNQKPPSDNHVRVGFLSHILNLDHARLFDPSLKYIDAKPLSRFLEDYNSKPRPFCFHRQLIKSESGREIELNLYGLFLTSKYFESCIRKRDISGQEIVQSAVNLAASEKIKYLGLGQFTSIVTDNGLSLESHGVLLTTGNSLTAAMACEAIHTLVLQRGWSWKSLRLGVVGFAGNICKVITQILAEHGPKLTLIHREDIAKSSKFAKAFEELNATSNVNANDLVLSDKLEVLRECQVIIVGTNSSSAIISSENIETNTIILDVSTPSSLDKSVIVRQDINCLQGGLAHIPMGQTLETPWWPLPKGMIYACLAETLMMGMLDINRHYSLGSLNRDQVLESIKLAETAGIRLAGIRNGTKYSPASLKLV